LIGGAPAHTEAAMDAVQLWRYKPYTLNGQPVEVDTSISVSFHLGDHGPVSVNPLTP